MGYKPLRRVVPLKSVAKLERSLRASNLSGAELARDAQLSRGMISRLRVGSSTGLRIESAERIEDVLGVSRGWLFDYSAFATSAAS